GQDFAADAGGARLLVGHDALGGGDDGHAEAAKDLRQLALAAVHAQARARGALQLLDDRAALEVLQHDFKLGLVVLALDDAQVRDVALVLQDGGDGNLDLGGRQLHRLLADGGRILDADQHVGDGISHAHEWFLECTDIRFREICIVPGWAGALAARRLAGQAANNSRKTGPCGPVSLPGATRAALASYQLALRRPGTSPRMVASRSMLRPRPNLRYTPRGRPDSSQRLRWRLGEESRGSLASLVAASIFSSYEAVCEEMTFFSSTRLAAYFLASFSRFASRLIMEVLAMVDIP